MDCLQDYYWRTDERMEYRDLKCVFSETTKGKDYIAMVHFCAAMLHRQNIVDDTEHVLDFLREVPIALDTYVRYEQHCSEEERLLDPKRQDQRHLCEFHAHGYNRDGSFRNPGYMSKPNDYFASWFSFLFLSRSLGYQLLQCPSFTYITHSFIDLVSFDGMGSKSSIISRSYAKFSIWV